MVKTEYICIDGWPVSLVKEDKVCDTSHFVDYPDAVILQPFWLEVVLEAGAEFNLDAFRGYRVHQLVIEMTPGSKVIYLFPEYLSLTVQGFFLFPGGFDFII